MTMRSTLVAVSGLALSAAVAWAAATVTFDPATGSGFVGKGDVQLAFGWNNAQMQSRATALSFQLTDEASYAYDCEWWTGPDRNRRRHEVTHQRTRSVNAGVDYVPRSRSQVNGFFLTGFGTVTTSGQPMPAIGSECPGTPGTGAVVVDVVDLGSTGAQLFVSFNGTSAPIWAQM